MAFCQNCRFSLFSPGLVFFFNEPPWIYDPIALHHPSEVTDLSALGSHSARAVRPASKRAVSMPGRRGKWTSHGHGHILWAKMGESQKWIKVTTICGMTCWPLPSFWEYHGASTWNIAFTSRRSSFSPSGVAILSKMESLHWCPSIPSEETVMFYWFLLWLLCSKILQPALSFRPHK